MTMSAYNTFVSTNLKGVIGLPLVENQKVFGI